MDLAKEVLKLRSDIPVILCTGYSDQVDEGTVKKLGVKTLIHKPINIDNFCSQIKIVLDNHRKENDEKYTYN